MMKKKNLEDELDFQILRQGAICMYYKMEILDNDLYWFLDARYKIIDIDSAKWTSKTAHKYIKEGFSFPDYYGENLNAFNDCLGDLYPDNYYQGVVIVFRHYDDFSREDKAFSEALLDIIACQSREWLLSGKRLIGLIQSNDPDLFFEKVGGYHPRWNGLEWLNERRRKI
jgi:RNAse (barnase) inhibitor barstar